MDVYLASANPHKWQEFAAMVDSLKAPVRLRSALDAGGMPEVEENGHTLEENARLKAEALLERVPAGAWVLADDTGLLVDALDGAPGVHSARYAGPAGIAAANNLKLLHELNGIPLEQRTARFSCVLHFARAETEGRYFTGTCEGHILTVPSGLQGFGYDPLFQPLGHDKSFADLPGAVKNSLSHRGRAVAAWVRHLQSMRG